MHDLSEFPYERCGTCCCHYDDQLKLCSIYESRPEICRVEYQFVTNYRQLMDWTEFVRLNVVACEALQELEKPSADKRPDSHQA